MTAVYMSSLVLLGEIIVHLNATPKRKTPALAAAEYDQRKEVYCVI